MQWEGQEESENVEDRRGGGGPSRGMVIGGIGGVGGLIVVILGLVFGVDFRQGGNGGGAQPGVDTPAGPTDPGEDKLKHFAGVVLKETEVVWEDQFRRMGKTYTKPKLVVFHEQVHTACGDADAGVGPFYCPGDSTVYIDLSFYRILEQKLKSGGEFARAYVLAHEVGHHVQRLLGYSARVDDTRRTGSKVEANHMSVRLELQADYFAGVWAHYAREKFPNMLEKGDIESAMNAASHIGDDYLQQQARGRVQPDSFTHGRSDQRQKWFMKGYTTGSVDGAKQLFDLPYNEL